VSSTKREKKKQEGRAARSYFTIEGEKKKSRDLLSKKEGRSLDALSGEKKKRVDSKEFRCGRKRKGFLPKSPTPPLAGRRGKRKRVLKFSPTSRRGKKKDRLCPLPLEKRKFRCSEKGERSKDR